MSRLGAAFGRSTPAPAPASEPAASVQIADVAAAYRLLLAREPEFGPDAPVPVEMRSFDAMLEHLAASTEFRLRVLNPAVTGAAPDPALLTWASGAYGLGADSAEALAAAPDWRAAVAALLLSAELRRLRLPTEVALALAAPAPASAAPAADSAPRLFALDRAFQATLGRLPDAAEVLAASPEADSAALVHAQLACPAFQAEVVGPVLRREPCWLDRTGHVDQGLAAWLADALAVPAAPLLQQDRLSWRRIYAALLGAPAVQARLVAEGVAWSGATLADFGQALAGAPPLAAAAGVAAPGHAVVEHEVVAAWGAAVRRHASPADAPLIPATAEEPRPTALFDPAWYRRHVAVGAGVSALAHYLSWWAETALQPGPLFDSLFYRRHYAAYLHDMEPLQHFITRGWRRHFDPNPAFDTAFYLRQAGPDLRGDPLSHYLLHGAAQGMQPHPAFDSDHVRRQYARPGDEALTPLELYLREPQAERSPNPLFDARWYFANERDVDPETTDAFWHYHRQGAMQGRRASALFNTQDYFDRNQDVRDAGVNPLGHYTGAGAREGRRAHSLFDEDWYVATVRREGVERGNAFAHFLRVGWREGLDPNPLFDTDWYLAQNPDVAARGMNPLVHYADTGWREGRAPNPLFDIRWYLAHYPGVAEHGVEPLTHYLLYGAEQGYDPSPYFSTRFYQEQHPELGPAGWNPLAHYMRIGRAKGFPPSAAAADALMRYAEPDALPVPAPLDPYDSWLEVNGVTDTDRRRLQEALQARADRLPRISVVMPTYNSDLALLDAAVQSVRSQLYGGWELCVCDDASPDARVWEALQRYAALDERIRVIRGVANQNISGASNDAAALATGEVIALMDHDDALHPFALAELALAYADNPHAEIVYSDDDKIDAADRRFAPQFKPEWSPTLLLSFMYVSHLFSFRRSLFEAVGGFRKGFEGTQDYDLLLRMSERTNSVVRIPRVLYHWRAVAGSTALSGDTKPEAFERGVRAVQEALDRRGIDATAVWPEFAQAARVGQFDLRFPDDGPSVTIVIPTKDKVELLRTCVESLKRTTYRNFDVLIVDNESTDEEALRYMAGCGAAVLRVESPPEGFSFAHIINAGVAAATAEYVLLLNNDTEVMTPTWLSQMVGYGRMPGVGAVGARLLYGDNRIQHAGITHGLHEGMAGHSFKLLADYDLGYMGLAKASREVAGVTAACMLTPRALFQELGGLDEQHFRVAYNDVDYCYRLVDAGYSCIQCASAELHHYEGKSRGFGDNPAEERAMRRKYRGRTDPFYNPNLTLDDERFGVARTHLARPAGRPLRTLFVSHNFNHEGAPNSLFEMATGLKARGAVDPVVIAPADGPLRQRYLDAGVPAHAIEHPLREWPAAEEMQARLRRLAQTFLYAGVEVVVANTADSFWAVEAARLAGLPCLWVIRESEPWATYYAHLPRHLQQMGYRSFQHPYRVVFVARSTLEAWSPLNGAGAFTLVRNGLNADKLLAAMDGIGREEARQRMEVDPASVVFTVVGTVSERKGQLDLVQAYAALPDDLAARAEVMIVGDRAGDYSTQLRRAVEALPPARARRVHVVAETSEVPLYLKGSDVFVCSSRVESYPRVTLEAMAAGLPLISTPVWGIREQLRENYNAYLYAPGDIGALSAHMAALIGDDDLRARFAARSAVVFESLPGYDFMLDQYATLVEQAAGTRS